MTDGRYSILSPLGDVLYSGTYDQNCIRKFTLMTEDSVTLNFSSRDSIAFPVGSSVGDFYIVKEQVGTWNSNTGAWDYTLTFDAYYWLWANKILRYVVPGVDSAKETSFALTATIDLHAAVILNCLNLLGIKYLGSPFRVDTSDASLSLEAKLVRYDSLSILGGIQAIAEAFECEWWIDGNAICFGKCENGNTPRIFAAGVNVSSISFSQGKEEAPNRLYVYGSERNLPSNYRQVSGNDTINGVVAKRLMLPEGTPYLQLSENIPEQQIVERVVTFDSVYPKVELAISEEPTTYTSSAEQEDGSTVSQTFYRIKYGSDFPFLSAYILPNEELHIIFSSGMLNGMDFAVKFNPLGESEKNADGSINPGSQIFEIVANEDYGRMLPDDVLRPNKGDEFAVYGWDTTKMSDLGLIAKAEQELLAEGQKALEEYAKDTSTCTCPMAWDYMKPLFEGNMQPRIGDAVTIIDTAHFGESGRQSRIIGYEYRMDMPYAGCTYTCGESITVGRLQSIEQKIEGLAKSGTKVQMQNSLDFLSKRYADRTPYMLSSDTGFEAGRFSGGVSGGILAIDKANGQSYAEVDKLYVRMKAFFESLTIINSSSIGGRKYITPGGSVRISEVEEMLDSNGSLIGWRCWYLAEQDGEKTDCFFEVGDQGICEFFNATSGTANKVGNTYYWRKVTEVSADAGLPPSMQGKDIASDNKYGWFVLSATDCESPSNDTPKAEDVVTQLGSDHDSDRQSAIMLSAVGADAPCIKLFQGIDSYSLSGKEIVGYGYDKAKGKAYFKCYGDTYIGAPDGSTFINYDSAAKLLEAKLKLTVTSTIGDKTIEEYIKEVAPSVKREDIEGFVNAIVDPKIEGIQNQIDGVIETWFYNGVPALTNYPASQWNTEALRIQHLGDLYYNNDTGTAYRFSQKADKTYYWNVITDDAITKALAAAKAAQDTADSKRRTFTSQPTAQSEYNEGDLWVNATYGTQYANDILRCIKPKASGVAFDISHWTLASKYTDDSALNTFIADYEDTIKDIQAQVDGKAETWYQATDPALAWKTAEEKAEHKGDLWYNTVNGTRWYYNGTAWQEENVPDAVFDMIDGKADIYIAKPTAGYHKNDLWFLESDYTLSGTAYKAGTLVVAVRDMASAWSAADWVKKDRYTDDALAQEAISQIAGYDYLRKALKDRTTIDGGLVLSTLIKLGVNNVDYTSQDTYSGISGVYDSAKKGGGIAAWYGGDMIDREIAGNESAAKRARTLFRMDGTGYFADGNITWNLDGSGQVAGGKLRWDKAGNVWIGSGISIEGGSSSATLASILNAINSLHALLVPIDANGNELTWETASTAYALKAKKAIYSVGFMSCLGLNPDGGASSGGATSLSGLSDVSLGSLANGDVLAWNGSKWVNRAVSTGLDMTALQQYLTANNYLTRGTADSLYQPKGNYLTRIAVADAMNTVDTSASWQNKRTDLTVRFYDVYNNGGPTSYGDVMEIAGRSGHWQPQLWFDGSATGRMRYRNRNYNTDTWGAWQTLAYLSDVPATMAWSAITGKPTTIGGYGIADAYTKSEADGKYVTALGVDGNYLTWTKNGTTTKFTAPYSEKTRLLEEATGLARGSYDSSIELPSSLPAGIRVRFKNAAGAASSKTWNTLIDLNAFTGNSATGAGYRHQFLFSDSDSQSDGTFWVRSGVNSTWNAWRKVLTDTNYASTLDSRYAKPTDNVASATQLQTARTLWGQSFDGTASVSGDLIGVQDIRMSRYLFLKHASATKGYYLNAGSDGSMSIHQHDNYTWTKSVMVFTADGKVRVGTDTTSYALNAASFICDSWVRTKGSTGWYNETYGGGIYMTDTSWVRIYNGKGLYGAGEMQSGWAFNRTVYGGSSWNNGQGALNVSILNNSNQTPLLMAYRQGAGISATGANRLFALELLNSGAQLSFAFGGASKFKMNSNGVFYSAIGMYSDGYVSALGQNTGSDIRMKHILGDVVLSINAIADAPAKFFLWKAGALKGQRAAGTIAQYWAHILPETVSEREDGMLQMQYDVVATVGLINLARITRNFMTQAERDIADLKATIKRQENRISELERRLAA